MVFNASKNPLVQVFVCTLTPPCYLEAAVMWILMWKTPYLLRIQTDLAVMSSKNDQEISQRKTKTRRFSSAELPVDCAVENLVWGFVSDCSLFQVDQERGEMVEREGSFLCCDMEMEFGTKATKQTLWIVSALW